jgi:hypothetical protein
MHGSHGIDPRVAGKYDSKSYADVTATAAGAVAVQGAGSRIGLWVALNGAIALSAVQAVNICVREGGALRAIACVNVNQPSVYLSVLDYGSVLQEQITLVSPGVNQQCSVGDVQRTFMDD